MGQVEAILDRLVETEGQPEVVQISGGEPTIHPQILDILAAARERDIRHVMLNTNGLRLARDRAFVGELASYRPVILDFITNRAAPNLSEEIRQALEGLWGMAAAMGTDKTTGNLACVACGCDSSLPIDAAFLKQHFFMLQVHGFMDQHTLDLKRLMKCCIHELLPDGRAVPFCAYNTLGYRQEVSQRQEQGQ